MSLGDMMDYLSEITKLMIGGLLAVEEFLNMIKSMENALPPGFVEFFENYKPGDKLPGNVFDFLTEIGAFEKQQGSGMSFGLPKSDMPDWYENLMNYLSQYHDPHPNAASLSFAEDEETEITGDSTGEHDIHEGSVISQIDPDVADDLFEQLFL